MKISFKLISVVLLLQIVTGVVVFAITRAYYQEQTATGSGQAADAQDLTTDDLIQALKQHAELGLPDDPEILNQQANQAFAQQDFARAAELYQKLVELSPEDASAYNNLGLTLHYQGRSRDALEILRMGTDLQPNFQRIWLTLGFVNKGIGENEAARQALERAIELGADTDPGRAAREMLDKLPAPAP